MAEQTPTNAESDRQPSMRPFFTVWIGQAISLLGSQLVSFALVWYLTESTGSATVLAFASLIAFAPSVVLGPIVGTLVDRWNRKWVMLVADATIALATLALAGLFALDIIAIWHIYVLMFIRGLGGAFHHPAMTASTTLMVPAKQLTRVAGMNQTLQGVLSIAAAPLGAILLELLPMQGILAIDVGTAIIAIALLAVVHIPQPERRLTATGQKTTVMQDFKEGLRYLWSWPGMLMLLCMAALINFVFAPISSLMPLLVFEHFGGGALQLGWIQSAFGVGIIVGGLTLSAWGGFKRRVLTSLMGLGLLGLFTIAMGAAPSHLFIMALVAMGFSGIAIVLTNGPLHAVMQATIDPEMQGRVLTLVSSVAGGMAPLGLAVAGPVADWIGIQPLYVIAGAVCMAMGLFGLANPLVRNLEDQKKNGLESVPAAAREIAEAAAAEH